jgi:glyoxylase-like metal-dependent hydrolase (beta-lactamase superfamily II)
MSTELLPGVHRIDLDVAGPMESVATYLLKGDPGHVLIDAGWDSPSNWESFVDQLASVGASPGDIDTVVATHSHADHVGLVARLAEVADATVMAHPFDRVSHTPMYDVLEERIPYLWSWLEYNGVPPATIEHVRTETEPQFPRANPGYIDFDTRVEPGTSLAVGESEWTVLWTPGHSPGHVCLYDHQRDVLLSGDHVLPNETPNISYWPGLPVQPLTAYLQSLERTVDLDPSLILPGHGKPIRDPIDRIDEIRQHHDERLHQVQQILADRPKTAWDVAANIEWDYGSFSEFGMDNQNLALTETLSHIEHLRVTGDVTAEYGDTMIRYRIDG